MKPYYDSANIKIYNGDALEILKSLPENSVQCCVTSPPYFGLRDYSTEPLIWDGDENCVHEWGKKISGAGKNNDQTAGEIQQGNKGSVDRDNRQTSQFCQKCGDWKGSLGLEPTPELFVNHLVQIFREVKRVLRDDGTCWIVIGDSYVGSGIGTNDYRTEKSRSINKTSKMHPKTSVLNKFTGLKAKDLVGIPWRVAFALQKDGWWLRQDIIWCLSGGTCVYARTQKGDMPITIKDMARLDPSTIQLWNGEKWTLVKGISRSEKRGDEIEFVLRSGERISCTPTHKFPTQRGVLDAKDITTGDVLERTIIPEPKNTRDTKFINEDVAWFVGLYIAEGSRSGGCIQIAGHSKEEVRWNRLCKIAHEYGGYIKRTINKNKMDIRIYGKILNSFIDEFVSGKIAKNKGLATACWKYSNVFLKALLDGYLSGDGHWNAKNTRWRIGFTRNYKLERDLRTLSARLGFNLTLNLSNSFIKDKKYPSFRGEIKFETTVDGHWNQKNKFEVIEIRKARCRFVYDIGVEDEPHLFALASGILTHNSKPNPMPESVKDRCTKAHEYIFLITKSARYFYNADAVKEDSVDSESFSGRRIRNAGKMDAVDSKNYKFHGSIGDDGKLRAGQTYERRNRRSVWTITTKPFKEAHFACVDAETECLTLDGWKKYNLIKYGDIAAQYDIETQKLSWANIEDIYSYYVNNCEMVKAVHRDLTLLLTPNHRTIIHRRVAGGNRCWKKPLIINAEKLKPSHGIPVGGYWEGKWNNPVSEDLAELLGWYISEGHDSSDKPWTVEIYQSYSANPKKVDRIESLLNSLNFNYDKATAERDYRGRKTIQVVFRIKGYGAIKLRELAPGKNLFYSVLIWSDILLYALLKGLIDGDGHRRKNRFSFIQKNKNDADIVQAIGCRLGYATKISIKRFKGNITYVVYFTKKHIISLRGTNGVGSQIKKSFYTGIIWCPKLPKGTWVARKNGRVFITGNTFPPELPRTCILAGSKKGDVILDPFAGALTTLMVSQQLNRNSIGIELSLKYIDIGLNRLKQNYFDF